MSVEGQTYQKLEDGTYDYTQKIYDEIKSDSFDNVVLKYSPYPGGSNPTVEIAPYFMGGEMADVPAKAARSLYEYGPKEYWPTFTFTEQEDSRLDVITKDLYNYTDKLNKDFVMGTKSISDWEEYVKQLDKLGTPELLTIYQAAIDRYHSLITALN